MNSFYAFFILSIALCFILLSNYNPAQTISTSVHCNPHKNICVACPHLSINSKTHTFNKYTQVSSKKQFYVLGTLKNFIMRNQCREMLQIFEKGENGQWKLPQSIAKYIEEKISFISRSIEVNLAHGVQYHLTISSTTDFIIFYEGLEPIYPLISNQREQNPYRLMKLSRSLCWGLFFALVATYLDRKLGIFGNIAVYSFPLVQITILWLMIYISYDLDNFSQLFVPELMCLVYILSKVCSNLDRHQKMTLFIGFISFLIICLADEELTIIADLLCVIVIKKNVPRLWQSHPKIKIAVALILLCMITNTIRVIGLLNILTYSAYTAKVIFIPMAFLIFQQNQVPQQSKNKLDKTARKYYGQY